MGTALPNHQKKGEKAGPPVPERVLVILVTLFFTFEVRLKFPLFHNTYPDLVDEAKMIYTRILRSGVKFVPPKTHPKTDRLGLKFDTQTKGLGIYIIYIYYISIHTSICWYPRSEKLQFKIELTTYSGCTYGLHLQDKHTKNGSNHSWAACCTRSSTIRFMVCSCSCGLWFWCFQMALIFTAPFGKGNWVGKSPCYKWKRICKTCLSGTQCKYMYCIAFV